KQENKTAAGATVNSNIAGLLTVFLPDGSDTKAYTCELAGFYIPNGNLQLMAKKWETPPPSNMAGLQGKFDPDGGGHGVAQISGYMSDGTNSKFQAIRDATESANTDMARLTSDVHAGIPGVFNGTYTRENEPPVKMKLTITSPPGNGLRGVATIYLPGDSGAKAYTYSLQGAPDGRGVFHLFVNDWETAPPKDFKNFKAMGFNGTLALDLTQNTARITSAPASGSLAPLYLPQFEATWDATESADLQGTIAAQKSIGSAEQAAAMKARDEMMKNAPPKELASKDLVRKSRQYWEGYQNDMLREVFDGGFGAAMDENEDFQKVFCTYVEAFSKNCPECLPANHQALTVTVITSMTTTKNLAWREGVDPESDRYQTTKTEATFTVDMDSRFVDKYKQFHDALNSPGAALRNVAAAAQPGGTQRVVGALMAIATDMQKFFADHPGKSAAMRQLNENFLRAVNNNPSLQQAGEKIDGAEAESDKDLLPGRYARFVDGANAYFIERAKTNPTKFGHSESHDTALCQRLAELYDRDMTRDEEYYYANDFQSRFLPIMGTRASCPDPAWPQLHPNVEKAIAEVK
ncbi:MAG TPA: hypothetical protein VHS31_00975, partial [Tepidisphaeraceae bacterium]|nr:hypothetical protein [Tepidisphaeraceae bacterium]